MIHHCPLQEFATVLEKRGHLVRWRGGDALPVLRVGESVFLAPIMGQGAWGTHHNIALRFYGDRPSGETAALLETCQGLLREMIQAPISWLACLDPLDARSLPSLHPLGGDSWLLELRWPCLAHCSFCERGMPGAAVPHPAKAHVSILELALEEAELPPGALITLGGAEPLASEGLEEVLEVLKRRGLAVHGLHTLGWPLTKSRLRKLLEAGLKQVRIPFYAAEPEVHDAIVRHRGAFEQGVASLKLFQEAGVAVSLHGLALKANTPVLSNLLNWVVDQDPVGVELAWPGQLPDAPWLLFDYLPRADEVRWALEGWEARGPVALSLPVCSVPEGLRGLLRQGPGRDVAAFGAVTGEGRRETVGFFEAVCDGCGARRSCQGLGGPYGSVQPVESLRAE